MNNTMIHGYKVFNSDWTCRDKQYTCPGIFEEDVIPTVCGSGMHFCKRAADCFNYYRFTPENKVAEVIAYADRTVEDDGKCATNYLEIVREISWQEVLELVNTGVGCTGFCNKGDQNSGDRNSGDRNSGNRNSGDQNSGDWNSGDRNSGKLNSGNRNSGNENSGNCNSGDRNSGNRNSGNENSGNCNSGERNRGNWNSGHGNSGNCNSGDGNSGNYNSGDRNNGNRNSGNRNSGEGNSGDWNQCSFSNGCFNTTDPKIHLFNKPSDWTYVDWLNSKARWLLDQIPCDLLEYIRFEDMTDEEKTVHPEAKDTGGYLKQYDNFECATIWWRKINDREKFIIKAIPNFDKEIFKEITGIDVDQ